MLVASKIPPSRILHLNFAETKTQTSVFLSETHINHDQIHHVRNTWFEPILFSPEDSHTKGLLVLLH